MKNEIKNLITDTRIHYLETLEEKISRLKSSGCHVQKAICGNAEPPSRLHTTRTVERVTCEQCKQELRKMPRLSVKLKD